jgi:hypothetical protein
MYIVSMEKLMKNVLSFELQLISEDELQNRLNTEGIFVPECLNFRDGNLVILC